jgi:hypothetical protein
MSVARQTDSPREFLLMSLNALLRLAALAAMGLAHFLLEKGSVYLVPENIPSAKLWLQDIAFAFFSLIYVYLLWDMVTVFIPRLRLRSYPGLEVASVPCLEGAAENDNPQAV